MSKSDPSAAKKERNKTIRWVVTIFFTTILISGTISFMINNDNLEVIYGKKEEVDVYAKLSIEIMQSIVDGRMTFQRAFMTGEMTAKGNFKTLRMLDQVFLF